MATHSIELPVLGNSQDPVGFRSQLILQGNQKQILLRKALIAQNMQKQLSMNHYQRANPFDGRHNQEILKQYHPQGDNLNYFQNLELNQI
jgi:hypothetical protein